MALTLVLTESSCCDNKKRDKEDRQKMWHRDLLSCFFPCSVTLTKEMTNRNV
jgi:hypothetical protein